VSRRWACVGMASNRIYSRRHAVHVFLLPQDINGFSWNPAPSAALWELLRFALPASSSCRRAAAVRSSRLLDKRRHGQPEEQPNWVSRALGGAVGIARPNYSRSRGTCSFLSTSVCGGLVPYLYHPRCRHRARPALAQLLTGQRLDRGSPHMLCLAASCPRCARSTFPTSLGCPV